MATRVFKAGDGTSDTPGDFVTLVNTKSVTSTRYQTLQTPDGVNYQVPVGKTLYITAINASNATGAANPVGPCGFGDTSINDSAALPTNPNYFCDANVGLPIAGGTTQQLKGCWAIPAGKYPFTRYITNLTLTMQGILV